MPPSSPSAPMDSQSKTLLERKLALFRPLDACIQLSQRLFQKAPDLNDQLRQHLDGTNASHRLYAAHRFIFQRIVAAVDGAENHGLPRKLENFLAFLDLAWVVLNGNNSKLNWSTFVLQDFDLASNAAVPLARLRRRFKQFLPETHLASVQMEVDEAAATERVFFRVAIIPKSRTGKNDEKNLLKKPATYLAYYPQEPYFYSDRPNPDPVICTALCSSLNSASYVPIPLSGPHLESLRQLRQNRDGRKTGKLSATAKNSHANLARDVVRVAAEVLDVDAGVIDTPILNKFTLECPAKFQGADKVIQDFHGGRLPSLVDQLDLKITFRGADILGTLRHFASEDAGLLFNHPTPNWVESSVNRGRNVIRLRKVDREGNESRIVGAERVEDEDDAMSVAGSEMTVMMRK